VLRLSGRRSAAQHEYEYTQVLPELMKTRISGFTVEFGRSRFDPAVLKHAAIAS